MKRAIDWSKAPEGATHYAHAKNVGSPWLKANDEGVCFWGSGLWVPYLSDPNGDTGRAYLANSSARPFNEWTGEGPPPIGFEGEFILNKPTVSGYIPHALTDWADGDQLTVVAHVEMQGRTHALFWNKTRQMASTLRDDKFRPVRTKEQIEAQEREDAIKTMRDIAFGASRDGDDPCTAIYDAGFRKQVAP